MRRISIPAVALFLSLAAIAANWAGDYSGDWSSGDGGAGGKFNLSLKPDGDAWKCSVTFTMGAEQYKTTVTSVKIDGSKLEAVYEYDLQGYKLRSKIQGQLAGGTLEGKYHSTTVADNAAASEGTWKATLKQ